MLQLSIQYSLLKARQSALQDAECFLPCQDCKLRISLWRMWVVTLSNTWSISLTRDTSSTGIGCRSTGASSLGYSQDRNRKPSYWWVPQGPICSLCCSIGPFPLLFLSYFLCGYHTRGAPFFLVLYFWLLMRNAVRRFFLWKAKLIVSGESHLLTPCQPNWINLEAQFLSPCPTSCSSMWPGSQAWAEKPLIILTEFLSRISFCMWRFLPSSRIGQKRTYELPISFLFYLRGLFSCSLQKAVKQLLVALPQLTAGISNRPKAAQGFRRAFICGGWKQVPAQVTDGAAGMNDTQFISNMDFACPQPLLLCSPLSPGSHSPWHDFTEQEMTSQNRICDS